MMFISFARYTFHKNDAIFVLDGPSKNDCVEIWQENNGPDQCSLCKDEYNYMYQVRCFAC